MQKSKVKSQSASWRTESGVKCLKCVRRLKRKNAKRFKRFKHQALKPILISIRMTNCAH